MGWHGNISQVDGLKMYHDKKSYEDMKRTMWKLGDWAGSILHNTIAHPLLPLLPKQWGNRFHDWTHKLWMKWGRYDEF